MNKVLYKYHYSGLFRHAKGLGFLITAPLSVEEVQNGIVRNNDINNPELLVGSYVRLDSFTGYNGRETFHKKLFPFANFKISDVVNYGSGTYAIIVDYPVYAPGGEELEQVSAQYENELFAGFQHEYFSGLYTGETEAQDTTGSGAITGTGSFRVSAEKFDCPADAIASNLISVPDGYAASKKNTEASPYKKMAAGGYSLKQLALIVLVIVVLIAIFKYLVK